MTTIEQAAPSVPPRPTVAGVNVHHLDVSHIRIGTAESDDHTAAWVNLGVGVVAIQGDGPTLGDQLAHLAAIGRTITARAEEMLGGVMAPELACNGDRYLINPDYPDEGWDVHHDGPCPAHPDAMAVPA